MESSTSAVEWDSNCDAVKESCGGYPDFWWKEIIQSGLGNRVTAKWGGDTELHVYLLR